ncbi:MAG: hypothetical protein K9M01_02095 [Candidatus Omnitrophica bacterium]|nr:hypothetical protein [Candidatus Omnitrophota bacterium]
MNSNILDLDDPSTYAEEYKQILYPEEILPILKDDFEGPQEIFKKSPEDVTNPTIKKLRYKCDEVFKRNYVYVMAYHACRTTDPNEYCRLGLLTSSRERLEAKARDIFTGIQNLDRAISEAATYFRLYDESISMYTSAKLASATYLNEGSHYLRMVAANLGREGEQRLSIKSQGSKPIFVKCKIPVSWFEDVAIVKQYSKLYLYRTSLIRKFIWDRIYSGESYVGFPESLVVFKAISPEDIVSILSADVCDNWRK